VAAQVALNRAGKQARRMVSKHGHDKHADWFWAGIAVEVGLVLALLLYAMWRS
jgi:bacteriorhodopsin